MSLEWDDGRGRSLRAGGEARENIWGETIGAKSPTGAPEWPVTGASSKQFSAAAQRPASSVLRCGNNCPPIHPATRFAALAPSASRLRGPVELM